MPHAEQSVMAASGQVERNCEFIESDFFEREESLCVSDDWVDLASEYPDVWTSCVLSLHELMRWGGRESLSGIH